MTSITISLPLDHPSLPTLLAALGLGGATSLPIAQPGPDQPTSQRAGSYADADGLACLDDAGAAIVADTRNASQGYLSGLRCLATSNDALSEHELLKAVGSKTLAGHRAATTKRVQRVLGRRAFLFHVQDGKIVVAPQTREALRRHFGMA